MKTRLIPFAVLFVVLVLIPANGVQDARADLCVYPRVTTINYWGWVTNGVTQCAAVIGPPCPSCASIIGQTTYYCDGSSYSWGTICEPYNGYNQTVEYGEDCDCGPDEH